ncbi:MAG: phosphate ABC transporter permease PstA [Candidatus Marinimicrobia bacterium]|nr:phosphate ABC transporter permease PstA [Candidatus Neomarinimicrobiota bacterium]
MNAKFREEIIVLCIRAFSYSIIFVIGYILLDIIIHGIPVLNWEFITSLPRRSGAEGGIFPAIVGTVCLVLGAVLTALPLGLGSAIYLTEYAAQGRFTRSVRSAIITLAGVPSIVYGLFGLGLFVLFFGFGASIIAGSLTLAFMILPTIVVSSEEALMAVPVSLREGSLALGATRWQTIYRNVLPYALPGMITGSILSIGRAAGETAPILLTVAAFYLPHLPNSIFDQVMALPYHIYILATQHPEADKVIPNVYGTALVLLIIVLGLNITAVFWRIRFRRKYRW